VRIRRSEITHIGGKLQRFSLLPEIKGILGICAHSEDREPRWGEIIVPAACPTLRTPQEAFLEASRLGCQGGSTA